MTEGPEVSPPRRDHAWLTPPWASSAIIASVLVTAVIAGLVWHSRQLGGLDAWVEGELGAQSDSQYRLAGELAMGLGGLTVCGIAVTAAFALVVLRNRHAAALALLAPAATLAVEKLLKPLVARRVPGATTFHYPSGHMAVATTLALSRVLIMHAARVRPMVRNAAAVFMGLLVLLMAVALLVQTAHLLSDVIGGVTTGAAVTLAAAVALESRPSATLGARANR